MPLQVHRPPGAPRTPLQTATHGLPRPIARSLARDSAAAVAGDGPRLTPLRCCLQTRVQSLAVSPDGSWGVSCASGERNAVLWRLEESTKKKVSPPACLLQAPSPAPAALIITHIIIMMLMLLLLIIIIIIIVPGCIEQWQTAWGTVECAVIAVRV